ncbi:hypothetical protein TRIP_B200287 [uncultured Desulfatiglans sp.]|nr:hypothetical protein TRIP_B200287 [uncultured Desulfatiglans sp.]
MVFLPNLCVNLHGGVRFVLLGVLDGPAPDRCFSPLPGNESLAPLLPRRPCGSPVDLLFKALKPFMPPDSARQKRGAKSSGSFHRCLPHLRLRGFQATLDKNPPGL